VLNRCLSINDIKGALPRSCTGKGYYVEDNRNILKKIHASAPTTVLGTQAEVGSPVSLETITSLASYIFQLVL
jgi:hypothetical protein